MPVVTMHYRNKAMIRKIYSYITLVAAALTYMLTSACTDSTDPAAVQQVVMPVSLSIPATGVVQHTRAPGDPGTYEKFEIPTVANFFFCTTYRGVQTVSRLATTLSKDSWSKRILPGGDSVYVYTGQINAMLPTLRDEGRVYVALSAVALPNITPQVPNTESDVLNMTFDVENRQVRNSLQDIYSSPYNLKDANGQYYGTIKDIDTPVPHVDNMILYHVAAKVDLTWNVAPDIQKDMRLTFMESRKMKEYGCLLFRPMENVYAADGADTEKGYDLTIIDNAEGTEVGRQWYGRASFYAIPSRRQKDGKFYMQLRMLKNNDDNSSANKGYIKEITLSLADNAVYTPWMRGTINITAPIEY